MIKSEKINTIISILFIVCIICIFIGLPTELFSGDKPDSGELRDDIRLLGSELDDSIGHSEEAAISIERASKGNTEHSESIERTEEEYNRESTEITNRIGDHVEELGEHIGSINTVQSEHYRESTELIGRVEGHTKELGNIIDESGGVIELSEISQSYTSRGRQQSSRLREIAEQIAALEQD